MKSLHRSFAGGEITPEMFGRLDLTKYQTGLKKSLNFITLPHGPAARRPGFAHVAMTGQSQLEARLIPFVFSDEQAYVCEFGEEYVRFHNENGTLLKAAVALSGWTQALDGVFTAPTHGFVPGDDVYFTEAGALSGRFFTVITTPTANTFTLLDNLNSVSLDTTGIPTEPGFVAAAYQVTSPFTLAQAQVLRYTQSSDVLTLSTDQAPSVELRRLGATNWVFATVTFIPTLAAPTGAGAVATIPTATNPITQEYCVTAVAADGVTESLQSSTASCSNNLSIYGNFNTISWSAVTGASRYFVYKKRGGAFGYIGQTTGLSLKDENILSDSLTTPPVSTVTLNTGVGEYPAAVAYYEQRRWFGGTTLEPQTIYATRNATESNLTSSIPSRADDGLKFRIASQRENKIQHLVPLNDLVALTAGAEFRIFADGQPFITPTSLSMKPQSFQGASPIQPALTSDSALYVQAQGRRIREIRYDPSGQGFYRSVDTALFAPHLFDGYTLREIAFSRSPNSLLWAVRSDGKLLGMTYVPDQSVVAWHQHETQGEFESCCTIPEGGEDVLYVIVKRIGPDGVTVRRSIERMTPRVFVDAEEAFFVDGGLTYRGSGEAGPIAATTITGLWHLEGATVQILADGYDVAEQVVTNGSVTLETAAYVVHVGFGYDSDLETLPAVFERAGAMGQATAKNVSKVYLRLANSSPVLKAGPGFDRLTENTARQVSDNYGSAPALTDREISFAISPSWNQDGTVCVRQSRPLPTTIASIATETQGGG